MRDRGNPKLMTLLAATLALALLLPAGPPGGAVQAGFTTSCVFWGEVTLCGEVVPPGTVITVSLDPVSGPVWPTTTEILRGQPRYWIEIPQDDPGTADKHGGVAGDDVYFSVTSIVIEGVLLSTDIIGPHSQWEMVGHIYHPLELCPYLGDANLDGVIDGGDITKVQRIMWGLDPPTPTADANNDGVIDAGDITRIRQIIWGLVDPISCCGCS